MTRSDSQVVGNMYTLRFATVFFLIAALWSSTFGRAVYDLESQPNSQRRDANDDKKLYVEYFANGTVKTETREELLEEFRKFANLTGIFEMFTDEQLGDKIDRERRTIFGEDERIECPVSSFPYCAVGKLDSGCTAILVGSATCILSASLPCFF